MAIYLLLRISIILFLVQDYLALRMLYQFFLNQIEYSFEVKSMLRFELINSKDKDGYINNKNALIIDIRDKEIYEKGMHQ